MPGDYGPAGKWIHDRAHRIMKEGDTKDEYGKKKGKAVAYAIATQQAHKLNKSPKDFRTPHGVHEAKQKYDEPKQEYQKTAMWAGFFDEIDEIDKEAASRLEKVLALTLAGTGAATAAPAIHKAVTTAPAIVRKAVQKNPFHTISQTLQPTLKKIQPRQ